MNLKNFPRKLDSKTSCLRITVPENLDLALEGLIRKVLREQPKVDDIYAFAADYFDALLKIRDKAGTKFTPDQLCPFHNDEDAHEMIKLATSFPKPAKTPEIKNPDTKTRRKEFSKASSKPEKTTKTKLPEVIQKKPEPGKKKAKAERPMTLKLEPKTEDLGEDEEFLKSDPIKVLVEKELMDAAKPNQKNKEDKKDETQVQQAPKSGDLCDVVDNVKSNEEKTESKDGKTESENAAEHKVQEENKKEMETQNSTLPVETVKDQVENTREEMKKELHDTKDKQDPKPIKNLEIGGVKDVEIAAVEKDPQESLKNDTNAEEQHEEKTHAGKNQLLTETLKLQDKAEDKSEDKLSLEGETVITKNKTEVKTRDIVEEKATDEPSIKDANINLDELCTVVDILSIKPEKETNALQNQLREEEPLTKEETMKEEMHAKLNTREVSKEVVETQKSADAVETTPGDIITEKTEANNANEKDVQQKEDKTIQEEAPDVDEKLKIRTEPEKSNFDHNTMKEGESENGLGENKPILPEDEKPTADNTKTENESIQTKTVTNEEGSTIQETKTIDVEGPETVIQNEVKITEKDENKIKSDSKAEAAVREEVNINDKEIKHTETSTVEKEIQKLVESLTVEKEIQKPVESLTVEEETEKLVESLTVEKEIQKPAENLTVEEETHKLTEMVVDNEKTVDNLKNKVADSILKQSTEYPTNVTEEGTNPLEVSEQPEVETKTENKVNESSEIDQQNSNVTEDKIRGEKNSVLEDVKEIDVTEKAQPKTETPLNTKESLKPEFEYTPEETKDLTGAKEMGGPADAETNHLEDELRTVIDATHIIKVEPADGVLEEVVHPEGVQVKTIQTHYYDTLQIPEQVTKEYRVHPLKTMVNTDTVKDQIAEATPSNLPTEATSPDLSVELNKEDSLMTPSSNCSLNFSDLSIQTINEMFLDSEKQYSDLDREERKYVTKAGEKCGDESHAIKQEVEEVIEKTIIPSMIGATPMAPRDESELNEENVEEGIQDKNKFQSVDSTEPADSSNEGKSIDSDIPIISVEVKTMIETEILEEKEKSESERMGGDESDVEIRIQATIDVPEGVILDVQEEKENNDEVQQDAPDQPSSSDTRQEDTHTSQGKESAQTSSGESDSTISSTGTEIKRTDSAKRYFTSTRTLITTQSLDLEKRSHLLKTRSLSSFRQGVTDFDVWNTIEKELEEAATKIQSNFRGYKTRKKLQRENAVQITTEESSCSTTPVELEPKEERQQSTGEFHDSIVLTEHPR